MAEPTRDGARLEPWSSLSFTLGTHDPEVGLLVEAHGAEAAPAALWSAERALAGRLTERYGIALDALERVEDLFERGTVAVRYAASLQGNAPPRFEIYLDAQAQGRWKARAVVEEALGRLGFGRTWPAIAEQVLRRGLYLDELRYLAIDLAAAGSHAPIKLYAWHHEATAGEVRAALEGSPLAARSEEFCLAMTGSLGPYRARPLVTCHTFVEPSALAPASRALHVPVSAYAPTDAVTRGRVSAYLALRGLSFDAYERALAVCAQRPLGARAGLQRYVGLRDDAGGTSLTVYVSPDAPAPARAAEGAPSACFPHPEEIVRRFENDIILADHPFLRRSAREPVQLGHLWLMIANFWEGIVQDFPKRLAQVIAKIDDDRARSVLTKQLNDELGEGVFAQAHKAMFRTLLEAVEPYRLQGPDDVLLAPGRAFGRALWGELATEDAYATLGRMMMIETYGEQTDRFMGAQFRRQDRIDSGPLRWLHLHEGLEIEHAKDSLTLARCVPSDPASIAAVWHGAESVVTASRRYFDALYRICFA